MTKKKIFISTAIDYLNDKPHLGHALEKTIADSLARYFRLLNYDVFFLSGTDENSLKNVKSAEKLKISTKELVDRNSKKFYQLKKALNLTYDDFIRTTQKRHKLGSQKLWNLCKKDIFKKKYKGLYCLGCEQFYKESELINGLCPEHKTKPELLEEEDYFFKLSKYQKKLEKIISKDVIKIIPKERKNEVLKFIKLGLDDICISRSAKRAKGWGIDVPGDSSQKIWVWFDALSNYINALGFYNNSKKFQDFWQNNNNKIHVIGKGILRFHAIYWPAILSSAKLSLPNKIFVHGYINVNGEKMSKSLGNVVDPFDLIRKYGTDPVRYFLLRESSPFSDLDFTIEKFKKRYNTDLAKGLGNLVMRVLTMIEKFSSGKIPKPPKNPDSHQLIIGKNIYNLKKCLFDYHQKINSFQLNLSLFSVWKLIGELDKYIEEKKPWSLDKKENEKEISWILYGLSDVIFQIAFLLYIFLPETSLKIARMLNSESLFKKTTFLDNFKKHITPGLKITKKTLFPSLD